MSNSIKTLLLSAAFLLSITRIGRTQSDSIFETWEAIDTDYPAIRTGFASLDSEFGSFTMKKEAPWQTDTGYFGNHYFLLSFSNYVPIDTVMARIRAIPYSYPIFMGDTMVKAYIPSDAAMKPGVEWSSFELDGSHGPFDRYFDPLSWQSVNYKLHCPMAWEITMGKPVLGSAHKYFPATYAAFRCSLIKFWV